MKLNANKTHSLIISRSRTVAPPHPCLYISGDKIDDVSDLHLLRVTFDSKMTFEKHIRSLASSTAQKTGLLCKCYNTICLRLHSDQVILCFYTATF